MRRWSLLGLLACCVTLTSAQTPVLVTFAWDADANFTGVMAWELEVNGQLRPCAEAGPVAEEWRCRAAIMPGTYTFRLRGVWPSEPGPWSDSVSAAVPPGKPPGKVTILWHQFLPPSPTVSIVGTVASAQGTTGASTLRFRYSNSAGADLLLVLCGGWDAENDRPVAAMFAQQVMEIVGDTAPSNADGNFVCAFRLDNPPTGEHEVVITHSGGVIEHGAVAVGVRGGTSIGPVVSATSVGPNVANTALTVPSAVGAVVLSVLYANANPAVLGGSQLTELNPLSGAAGSWLNVQTEPGNAPSVPVNWTHGATHRIAMGFSVLR